MTVVVLHDGSPLSDLLVADFTGHGRAVDSLDVTAAATADVASRCRAATSVVYLATGWDPDTTEREPRQIEAVIGVLGGSAKKLVYVSDATVIGDTGDSFGNEDSEWSSGAPHLWRAAAERTVVAAASVGVQPVIVRLAFVHGRGSGAALTRMFQHARATGEAVYVGDGHARLSTVHVDDAVSLIRVAVERSRAHTVYVAASDQVMSWRDVADVVATAAGRRCHSVSISADQASRRGFDARTMSVANVMRDTSAYRRLGWRPSGPGLGSEVVTPAA
jgi:nucleoside-diphosphate-sugar epimerase